MFEPLENHRLLAVIASLTAGGELLVQRDADGAVEIVAVSQGAYCVTDNAVVIADSDTLTGATLGEQHEQGGRGHDGGGAISGGSESPGGSNQPGDRGRNTRHFALAAGGRTGGFFVCGR
jgi:hypothetical protein